MKDIYHSKKQSIAIRRIEIAGITYTIRPSFLMPYMTGVVDEIEKALFMRKFNVPFWALSYAFGKDPMYWYRIEQSLGRNSIVGTTIRNCEDILSLANISSLLKLLTFSHRPAKFPSMMKMLLKLILNILLGSQKDSDLALETLRSASSWPYRNVIRNGLKFEQKTVFSGLCFVVSGAIGRSH